MSGKVAETQAHAPSGTEIARMIMEFWDEFRGIYPEDVMVSTLCAVGPLQTMIGLAIKNEHLSRPTLKRDWGTANPMPRMHEKRTSKETG